ncbi:MAG: hypothetical protein PWP54_1381 [Thermosipho sp. (in: thermotogales)]|nr:hypothetical protein [Thermosipho sp. (in: thermotogales)]
MKKLLISYLVENIVAEQLVLEIKNKIYKVINFNPGYKEELIGIFGNISSAVDELTNEIFIKLKEKKDILLNKTGDKIDGYLYILIKNHIIDTMRRSHNNESLDQENDFGKEEIEYFKHTEEHYKPEWEFVAEAFVEEMKKFKPENLCYFLFKMMYSEEIIFKGKSKDAKYKIVQRTKEKLRNLVKENGLNDKEFSLAIRIYMSEICEKIRKLYSKDN